MGRSFRARSVAIWAWRDDAPAYRNFVKDFGETDLCYSPFYEGTTGPAGTIDRSEVIRGAAKEVSLHEIAQWLCHLIHGVEVDDALDEVVASDDALNGSPTIDFVTE